MYLVLLDVNGLFGTKVSANYKGARNSVALGKSIFIYREGIKDFVHNLCKKYTVGIYSSTSSHNLDIILNYLWPDKKPFSMILDRSYTNLDPEYGNDGIEEWDTVKILSTIWQNAVFNSKRIWNENNTLLIDDEERKVRFNEERNILIVEAYSSKGECENLFSIQERIVAKLEEL